MQGFKFDANGAYIEKDPQAILSYKLDFDVFGDSWLSGDTIASCSFTVPAGLTKVAQSNTTTTATVKLSGGTAGISYNVTCHIVTAQGNEDDRSFRVVCKER